LNKVNIQESDILIIDGKDYAITIDSDNDYVLAELDKNGKVIDID